VTGSVNGGQCLAAVRTGTLPVEAAITIIMVISLAVGFMGYRIMHLLNRYAWIPTIIAIIILVGAAGDQLWQQSPTTAKSGTSYMASK
jgi:purine-cytosine permease-like protein